VLRRPARRERPGHPFTGYKLAHAVLSADGGRAGFAGLSIGARRVYGVTAEASCVWSRRHTPPVRRCGCGFYCLTAVADATALGCATENRAAVLLEVAASGRFIRYDRGLRYSRQRVRAVRVGRCGCGSLAGGLLDDGRGFAGWRCLAPACQACAAGRPFLALGGFGAALERPVPVTAGEWGGLPVAGAAGGTGGPWPGQPDQAGVATLSAEIALVHARLDELQARLSRYDGGPGADG
jgi:hypothetical protein